MKEEIRALETKYGLLTFKGFFLSQGPVFITTEESRIAAGEAISNGKRLKKGVALPAGIILMPRKNEKYATGWCWQIFSHGLYEAWRACLHIRDSYEAEEKNGEIVFLESSFRDFAMMVYQLLKYRELSVKEKEEIEKKIDEYRHCFQPAQNPLKQQAEGFLKGATGIRDRTGRPNPTAALTQLHATCRRLELRVEQIKAIDPRIGRRQIALILEKDRIHRQLIDIYKRLADFEKILQKCKKYLPPHEIRSYWQKQIVICLAELEEVRVRPYVRWVINVRRELGQMVGLLKTQGQVEKLGKLKQLTARVIWALKFKRARWDLEQILWDFEHLFRRPKKASSEDKVNLVTALQDFLSKFSQLDDRLFIFQVKEKIDQELATALDFAYNERQKEAKKFLKQAARRL